MKWFLCALCCLTEGLSVLRAQIMPDSSVQICAYWTPGDKYAYEAREEKFKIDDQGDTTLVYRQSERRVFEILSQTKDRYKIRLTYGDYMTTDKEDQLVHDAIVSATGPCVVEFETDETGSLLGIANLETLVAQAEASVEPAVRVMWETIPSAERKNFPKKNFRKYMARTLSDPSVVINAVNDDLGRMFFFHGARLDSTQVYEFDETFAPLLGGRDSVRGKTSFWIDGRQTDSYSAVCNTYTEADGSKMLSATLGQFLLGIANLETLVAQAEASVEPAVRVMWETIPSAERKNFPKKNFRKYMARTLSDPSVVINAVNDDLGRMFFFHGARLDSTQVYEFDETFAPLLGGRDSVRGKTSFWIDGRQTDSYSAVCNTYTEADGSKMLSATLGQFVTAFGGEKAMTQAMRDSIASGMSGIRSRMEQFSSEEIHLDTGWPLHLFFERTIYIDRDLEPMAAAIVRRTLDIIVEEEQEEEKR